MLLSDISVRRPVFAAVISLLLLAFGALSFNQLPVREYPNVNPPMVSVRTSYVGASADVVESRITQVMEDQVSGIEGIKSIRSSSRNGSSSITIEFDLDRDIDQAANDVRDRVGRIGRMLPEDADPPRVAKFDSDARPILYMSFSSSEISNMELTDYAERYIVDRFATIGGVAEAAVSGSGRPAMRIWLDRLALAARDLTVNDIESALRRENVELPAGRLDSQDVEFQVRMARNYRTADEFAKLVIGRGDDGYLVRLGDIARVEVGPQSLRSMYRTNGENTIGISIVKQSTANTVDVLTGVISEMERIDSALPEHMSLTKSSDDSVFIREAISAVYWTIGITTGLVALVILGFLGSFRAMLIPVVTIPVCLTASFIVLAGFGFSVNLVTLLALVLSIGLLVDDSIVVLENAHRRIELGEPPLLAAFRGARQVGFAVIATTAVIVAVFVPIMFLEDNIGRIFSELAVTVCAAVIFSSILALSLTPMMCSKLLHDAAHENTVTKAVDRGFSWIADKYVAALGWSLRAPWVSVVVALGVGVGVWQLLENVPQAYAPQEDQGQFMARVTGPEGASFGSMKGNMLEVEAPLLKLVETGAVERSLIAAPMFGSASANSGVAFVTMPPFADRTMSTQQVMGAMMGAWSAIPGVRAFPFMRSGLSRRGGGQPVQFVLGGSTYEELAVWRDIMLEKIADNPNFARVDTDLKETQPQVMVSLDKDRAAVLGVSVQNIGRTLQTMMSENRITTYVDGGEEYDVIMQAEDEQRATPDDLRNIYVRSETTGQLIPLSNFTIIQNTAGPGSLNRYNRLRAVTISANLAPGYALGDALAYLEGLVRAELPETAQIDYQGESLEYKESSGGMYFTLGLALLVVFLVLAAQFESFVHPIVIMVTVPLAVGGGLLGLLVADKTLNIYSQIGIVILIGIAAKNGILIVEFINQLRDQGREFRDAVLEGSRIRFRPVVMTTISTIMGSIPLMMAAGAGSASRITLGVVIFSGVSLATLLTLFVVPTFYQILAGRTKSPGAVAQELESMQGHVRDEGLTRGT